MKLLLLLAVLSSSTAFSFPENIRIGYASCSACHVSPTGGGVLTDYGTKTANEYLPMFPYSVADPVPGIDTGWDVRLLHLMEKSPDGDRYQRIVMESQTEAAVHLSDQITFDAAYGMYGYPVKYPVKAPTSFPVYYLKLSPRPWYSIRVGRFDLPYGLRIPDHSANIREGLWFPPNSQRDTFELNFISERGEVSIANFDLDTSSYSGSVSLFVGRSSKVSVSGFLSPAGSSVGASAIIGWTRNAYSLAEIDVKDNRKAYSYLSYQVFGYEVFRGFHVKLMQEKTWDDKESPNKYSLSIQSFPVSGLDVIGSVENYERPKSTTYILMTHFFL